MSKTRPLGPGTRNLTVNVPDSLYAEVAGMALSSNCSMSEYLRAVLEFATERRLLATEKAADREAWFAAVKASQKELPKIRREIHILLDGLDESKGESLLNECPPPETSPTPTAPSRRASIAIIGATTGSVRKPPPTLSTAGPSAAAVKKHALTKKVGKLLAQKQKRRGGE